MISSSLYANHLPTFNVADFNVGFNWDVNNKYHKSLKDIYFFLSYTHTHVIQHFLAEYKQGLKIWEDTESESLEMLL